MNPSTAQNALLASADWAYQRIARPILFRSSAQTAHERVSGLLSWIDRHDWAVSALKQMYRFTLPRQPIRVGGAVLPHPMILAAGFVKGQGFASEEDALAAVSRRENIIPGWHSVPTLVGAVEFGSFTRWPRTGNTGQVLWRDPTTRSLQNRIGLKNPGVVAAAAFLSQSLALLPPIFGINIAPSPGVDNAEQEQREVYESVSEFIRQGVMPTWFTLNLSCPNTEDDPANRQTEARSRAVCSAALDVLADSNIPLWVKISPALAASQYRTLMRVFAETGVRAIVATNTISQPTPNSAQVVAGVSGGRLFDCAVEAVKLLVDEKRGEGYTLDVIACGGVQDGSTYAAFAALGVCAAQYWSALIFRGPLAAALIEREARKIGVFVDD